MMRLDKYLCDLQVGTRSEVKDIVKKGQVSVNGEIVKKSDIKIDENKDEVCCFGKTLSYAKFHYYIMHKPAGVITATTDKSEQTVMDLLPDHLGKNLSPVGRLDKDTEGLLFITDDGELSHNLLSPKKHVPKTYYVECSGTISDTELMMLEEGVDIGDDKPTAPAKVKLIEQQVDHYMIELTITEGRFHQVKRMVQAVGGEVTYLKRLTFGALVLEDTLQKGDYRELTKEEVESLKNR